VSSRDKKRNHGMIMHLKEVTGSLEFLHGVKLQTEKLHARNDSREMQRVDGAVSKFGLEHLGDEKESVLRDNTDALGKQVGHRAGHHQA